MPVAGSSPDEEGEVDTLEREDHDDMFVSMVAEYDHDVSMPALMIEEDFNSAMEHQFLQAHRKSLEARSTLTGRGRRSGEVQYADANSHDALLLFALFRPNPLRWWCLEAARANFFLDNADLRRLSASPESKTRPPAFSEPCPPDVDDFRYQCGGLQGPLFSEVRLLEAALEKHGRAGFLRRRIEADALMQQVTQAPGQSPWGALGLRERLCRARLDHWARTKGIAHSSSDLVHLKEDRWWTLPAALEGFRLSLSDVEEMPHRRDTRPEHQAHDFGVLLRERDVVALARKRHKGRYTEMRRKARRRGLWVECVKERYREALLRELDEREGGEEDPDWDWWVVDSLPCALGWHQTTTDEYNASRSLSSVSDLVGLKWVTREMARELFNLSTAELSLLPRLPGLLPQSTGPAGDLFNEHDLQVLANACAGRGLPYALRRKGLDARALREIARETVERRESLRGEAEEEDIAGEGEQWPDTYVRVMLGLEGGDGETSGDRGGGGAVPSAEWLRRAVRRHGGVPAFLRHRASLETAMGELEERRFVLGRLQTLAGEGGEGGREREMEEDGEREDGEREDGEREDGEEPLYISEPVLVRHLFPAAKARARWFSQEAVEVNFLLTPQQLADTAESEQIRRLRYKRFYYREDAVRRTAESVHGAATFQRLRLAAVTKYESSLCEEILKRWRESRGGGRAIGRGGDERLPESASVEADEAGLWHRIILIKELGKGQYFETTGEIGQVGWRGGLWEEWRVAGQQGRAGEVEAGNEYDPEARIRAPNRLLAALGAHRLLSNLVAAEEKQEVGPLPMLCVQTSSSIAPSPECLAVRAGADFRTVADGLGDVLLLPDLRKFVSRVEPAASRQDILDIVRGAATAAYAAGRMAALKPPVPRTGVSTGKRKRSVVYKQGQEDEVENIANGSTAAGLVGSDVATEKLTVAVAIKLMPWPLSVPLKANALPLGSLSLTLEQALGPLVSMLESHFLQMSVNGEADVSSPRVPCLPGGVELALKGETGTKTAFVLIHPLLAEELLSIFTEETARKMLTGELQGGSLLSSIGESLQGGNMRGTPGIIAASVARQGGNGKKTSKSTSVHGLMTSLKSLGESRAYALNRRLVTAEPILAAVRAPPFGEHSSSHGARRDFVTRPAVESFVSIERTPREDPYQMRHRFGCGTGTCLDSTSCRVCNLCLPRHCGCELTKGALPNQMAPRVAKEQAFFSKSLLQQEREWRDEQQQQHYNGGGKDLSSVNGSKTCGGNQKEAADFPRKIRGTLPFSILPDLRREENLRGGSDGRTLRRIGQAVVEDAVERECNKHSPRSPLPFRELLLFLRERAAQKVILSIKNKADMLQMATVEGHKTNEHDEQKIDDNDPTVVVGQLDESALIAVGVIVEEAVESMVQNILERALAEDWNKLYRGIREATEEDVRETLHTHLRQQGSGSESTELTELLITSSARKDEEDDVHWAIFGHSRHDEKQDQKDINKKVEREMKRFRRDTSKSKER